jgi:hypothetical protein
LKGINPVMPAVRHISRITRVSATLLLSAALSACSSGSKLEREFTAEGVKAPTGQCNIDPRSVAQAEPLGKVDGPGVCGIRNGWRVTAVSGVGFSRAARLECQMVGATRHWLDNVVQPAAQSAFGERVVSVRVAASYACRARNNQRGSRVSEHSFGNALDVSAFTLASGRTIEVDDGWSSWGSESGFLKQVHGKACGTFKTVLGPEADSHHHNHLHFDLARHGRSGTGTYCK